MWQMAGPQCVFHRFLIRCTQCKTEANTKLKDMSGCGGSSSMTGLHTLWQPMCLLWSSFYLDGYYKLRGCYSTIGRNLAEVFYLVRLCPVLLNFWINCKMCNWTNSFFPSTASLWSYGSGSQVHVQHTLVYKLLSHPWGNSVLKVGWVGRWW